MTKLSLMFSAALCAAGLMAGTSANALTMQECSAKYKAAQAAGTTKGVKWNDFRKAECGADASATPAAATTAAPATPPSAPKQATTPPPAPAPKQATAPVKTAPAPASAPAGNAVYPTAVAPKYSTETAGKARMHTCLDQYNANKASNANGGLNWIQKGGGYYSECNKRLKG